MTRKPFIKDMTNEALVEHYHATRALLANAANGRMARSTGRLLRELDITVAVARKRGVDLTRRPTTPEPVEASKPRPRTVFDLPIARWAWQGDGEDVEDRR